MKRLFLILFLALICLSGCVQRQQNYTSKQDAPASIQQPPVNESFVDDSRSRGRGR